MFGFQPLNILIMNEHLISKSSEIVGKNKTYTPLNIIYFGDSNDKVYENLLVVSCFLNEDGERRYNDVRFHNSIKVTDISSVENAHLSYVLQTSKKESSSIIEDIKKSEYFKQ